MSFFFWATGSAVLYKYKSRLKGSFENTELPGLTLIMVDFFVIDFTEPYRVRYLCFPTRTKRPKAFLGGFEIVGYFVAEKIECGLVLYIWFVQYSKNRGARKRSLNKRFGGFAFSALRGPKIWRSGPKIIIILWSCKFPRYKLPTILLNTEQISVKNIAHLSGSVWLFRLDFFLIVEFA